MATMLPPPGSVLDPVPLTTPAEQRKRALRGVRNPGFYDDNSMEFKKIAQFECFAGGRLKFSSTFRKGSKVLVSTLNADMDASLPERVSFNTGLAVGAKGDVNQMSAGFSNGWGRLGSFSHRFNNKLTLKSDFQFGKEELINVELQRKGVDCCHAAKYSLTPNGHCVTASCMQALTRFWSMGGRIDCNSKNNVLTGALRYKRMFKGPEGEKAHHGQTLTLTANSDAGINVMFTRQLDPHTHLATEIAAKGISEFTTSVAGLYTYQTFDFQAKITPSTGLVSCLLEHRRNSLISILCSGQYGQWTGDSKFGVGLKVTL